MCMISLLIFVVVGAMAPLSKVDPPIFCGVRSDMGGVAYQYRTIFVDEKPSPAFLNDAQSKVGHVERHVFDLLTVSVFDLPALWLDHLRSSHNTRPSKHATPTPAHHHFTILTSNF